MSELSVLIQARKEIKADISKEKNLPKWNQTKIAQLTNRLNNTNEMIAVFVERNSEGERTLF